MASTIIATRRARLLIDGKRAKKSKIYSVYDKFLAELTGHADCRSEAQAKCVVLSSIRSFHSTKLHAYQRYEILLRVADLLDRRREEIVETSIAEAGVPIGDATSEVKRAVQTCIFSAEERKRITREGIPIESAPGKAHRMAFTIRVPQGFICGITAFNPRNMVAHKIAPAQGAGNTVFIKLSQATPFCAAILFEILLDAGLPPEHASLVQEDGAEVLGYLVNYRRIAVYSFTGSTSVGRHIRAQVGIRPSTLELGSIAATVVYEDAYLERAAPRIVNAGSRWADQFCNSTQSLFVHEQVVQRFTQLLIDAMQKLPVGDPHNPDIVVASMICVQEAERAERWTNEAVAQGAHFLFGGKRLGSLLLLTILANITSEMKVMCEELFAPVLSLISYHDFKGVIDEANSRPFGLAARIVTRDIDRAMLAARRFYVRAVHINEASASRVDMIAFAGIKNSGMGRESPKCAMQEMTEERLVTISLS